MSQGVKSSKIVSVLAKMGSSLKRHGLYRILVIMRALAHWALYVVQLGKKKILPPLKDPLLLKTATELAKEILQGKIKSEDVVKSYICRIRAVNPYLNAVVDDRFEEAVEEAKEVDVLVASASSEYLDQLGRTKPLLGVPITVKVLLCVKGLRCTAGCLAYKDLTAHEDATAVAMMKRAGAIVLANTNSSECGMGFECYNYAHGVTRNPYDTTRTCGGSSGGEGALIGAAGSLIGLGNDLAGSVRFPSFNCCLFAHKITAGLISNRGTFPVPPAKIEEFLCVGPMCRYAEDMITSMKVLAGTRKSRLDIGKPVDFSQLKIYYLLDEDRSILVPKLDNEIKSTIQKAVAHFASRHRNEPKLLRLKNMRKSFDISVHMLRVAAGDNIPALLSGGKETIKPVNELLKKMCGLSDFTIGPITVMNVEKFASVFKFANLPKMERLLDELKKDLESILDDNAVMILPTFSHTAMRHFETNMSTHGIGLMAIFNVLGLPVTQCSMGLDSNGIPTGFQVVAGKEKDNLCLAFAVEIERAFGGWVPPGSEGIEKVKTID